MNHVRSDQKRYAQPRLLDCHFLKLKDTLRSFDIEHATHKALADTVMSVIICHHSRTKIGIRRKIELSDLFLKSHPRHQVAYELIHPGIARSLGGTGPGG